MWQGVRWRAAVARKGPNDAPDVVWAFSKYHHDWHGCATTDASNDDKRTKTYEDQNICEPSGWLDFAAAGTTRYCLSQTAQYHLTSFIQDESIWSVYKFWWTIPSTRLKVFPSFTLDESVLHPGKLMRIQPCLVLVGVDQPWWHYISKTWLPEARDSYLPHGVMALTSKSILG